MLDEEDMGDTKEDVKTDEVNAVGDYEWLDREYVQKALREGLKNKELKIENVEVLPATGKGENYASVVHKCYAKDSNGGEHRIIIKCLPASAFRQNIGNKTQIFRKEIDMYEVIFPRFKEIAKEMGAKMFWPKYYFSTMDGLRDTVVLKDAGLEGFVMKERRKGLDAKHLSVALETLAKFHAFSVVMKLRNPEEFQSKVVDLFPERMYRRENKEMDIWMDVSITTGSKMIRDWGGEKYTRIADKIKGWQKTLFDDAIALLQPQSSVGSVLNHGDFWVNNMLFKYADRDAAASGSVNPVEVMMLDFQIARCCSPAVDLSYLMVTSVTTETRRKHWEQLLENVYVRCFWNVLDSLGHRGDVEKGLYTMDWLKSEMDAHLMFTLFATVTVLKPILASAENVPDLDTITEDDFMTFGDIFGNIGGEAVFRERFQNLIDDLDEKGIFH